MKVKYGTNIVIGVYESEISERVSLNQVRFPDLNQSRVMRIHGRVVKPENTQYEVSHDLVLHLSDHLLNF